MNSKASDMTCVYVESNDCKDGKANESYYDTTSKKVITCSSSKCLLSSASGYYIDYGSNDNKTYLITCSNSSCTTEDHSSAGGGVEFFLNAGPDKSSKPIIYFNGTNFSPISGDTTGVYKDNGSTSNNVITCQSVTKCSSNTYESGIFISSAHIQYNTKNSEPLIECSSSGCNPKNLDNVGTGNYTNNAYFVDRLTSKLIQCDVSSSIACSVINREISNKYYLDYTTYSSSCDSNGLFTNSKTKSSYCALNVIYCNSSSICKSQAISSESQFIDGDDSVNINLW